jgi:hypothetical protein
MQTLVRLLVLLYKLPSKKVAPKTTVARSSLTQRSLRCSSVRSKHARDFVVSPSSNSPSSLLWLPSLDADLIAVVSVCHGRPSPDGLSSSSCPYCFKPCAHIVLVSLRVLVLFSASPAGNRLHARCSVPDAKVVFGFPSLSPFVFSFVR